MPRNSAEARNLTGDEAPRQPKPPSKRRRESGAESREAMRKPVERATFTEISPDHLDRNEDTVLGDPKRILNDITLRPEFLTDEKFRQDDYDTYFDSLKEEQKYAGAVREAGYNGVLDGVSGYDAPGQPGKKTGSGLLASRVAGRRISEELARNPGEMTVESSTEAMVAAVKAADKAIRDYKKGRPDIAQMSTTAMLSRTVKNEDGTYDMPWVSGGDCRIYVLDGVTNDVKQMTRDDIALDLIRKDNPTLVTNEMYDKILAAKSADELPEGPLRKIFKFRYQVVNSLGGETALEPRTGVISGLKSGDRVLMTTDGLNTIPPDRLAELLRSGATESDIAAEARKTGSTDDITMTRVEFNAEAPASGRQEVETPVEPSADPRALALQERRRKLNAEIKAQDDFNRKRGGKLDTTNIDKERKALERDERILELQTDYNARFAEVQHLQEETQVSPEKARAEIVLESGKAKYSEKVYDAALLLSLEQSTAKLEETEQGKWAANFVRGEIKKGRSINDIMESANAMNRDAAAKPEKLAKMASQHEKMALIMRQLKPLLAARDKDLEANEARMMSEAQAAFQKAARGEVEVDVDTSDLGPAKSDQPSEPPPSSMATNSEIIRNVTEAPWKKWFKPPPRKSPRNKDEQ